MSEEVKLIQAPVIQHALAVAGQRVTERLAALNIEKQVATIDTVKALKELRAELNKELKTFEDQRKAIKTGVMNPYNEFENLYKTEISERYTAAIEILKDKIAEVENKVKADKAQSLRAYWSELCFSVNVDFFPFEKTGIEVNLSTSEKAYKEKLNEIITRVQDDLKLIETNECKAEVLAEYKVSLNASKAITEVTARKERERVEAERIKVQEWNRRIAAIKAIGMVFLDMTNAYEYDDQIYIKSSDVENMTNDEFSRELILCDEAIKIKKQQAEAIKKQREAAEKGEQIEQPAPPVTAPVSAPVVEKKEEIVSASFMVHGTMRQLRELGRYMKTNGINYTNI
jgi:hypothetical protein